MPSPQKTGLRDGRTGLTSYQLEIISPGIGIPQGISLKVPAASHSLHIYIACKNLSTPGPGDHSLQMLNGIYKLSGVYRSVVFIEY